jgi:hypothetical protein
MAAHEGNKTEGLGRSHPVRMFLLRLFSTIAIGCLAALILPSRFTEEMGAQKIAKLAAPFEGYKYSPAKRDDITILLIDEASLQDAQQSWPATFDFYVTLLKYVNTPANIAPPKAWHPRAVFFDIVFEHQQDKAQLQAFEKALDAIDAASQARREDKNGRPAVFLAARLHAPHDLSINEDLDAYAGATEVAIEYSPNEVDRIAWTYHLFLGEKEDEHEHAPAPEHATIRPASMQAHASATALPPERRSAALSIYEDAYGRTEPVHYRYPSSTMMLTWGLDTAEYGLLWKAEEDEEAKARKHSWLNVDRESPQDPMYCTSDDDAAVLRNRAEERSIMRSLSRPLCVYHRTIHASQLRNMTPGQLKAAFDDKVVMIGTALRYSNDIVVSPLHDRIPGVFLHAMALDNLLTSNGHYQEYWEPPQSPSDVHWLGFAALCLVGLAPVALVRAGKEYLREKYRHWRHSRPGRRPTRFHRLWWRRKTLDAAFKFTLFIGCGLILLGCAIGLLVLGQSWLHVPFLAVSHLVACAMAVEWFDWGSDFVNWILDVRE